MARRKPRKARPKDKGVPKGYDSLWEAELHKTILKDWQAHGIELTYTITKKYLPDFKKTINGITYYIESKGRFWDSEEYSKYKWAREALKENERLIFIFMKPEAAMPRARKRADGTKLSHGEWATKNGFTWFTQQNFRKEFRAWIKHS